MSPKRIPEIDMLRTLALALMITYHLIYDLDQWTNATLDVDTPFWFLIGKTAAILFIFLSGFSSGFSKRPVKNGLRVLFFGMIITVVTYVAFPEQYIRFGILHFLGVMMLLYPLLQKLPNSVLIVLSVFTLAIGFYIKDQVVNTPLLLPLGLMYPGFSTMDFYPLFPYSGVTFLGIFCYRYFLANNLKTNSQFTHSKTKTKHETKMETASNSQKKRAAAPIFAWISRHSLSIYLIHQPILLALIFGLKGLDIIP